MLSYLLIFPSFLALRLRHPGLERPFRAPGGRAGAVAITIVTVGWALVAAVCLLWPGFGTADPDAALPPAFAGDRLQFELLVLAPIVAVVAACAAFQVLARHRLTLFAAQHMPLRIQCRQHMPRHSMHVVIKLALEPTQPDIVRARGWCLDAP